MPISIKLYSVLIFFLMVSTIGQGAEAESQTIYLVRHSEKVADGSNNPPLAECGKQRSEQLAKFFRSIKLTAIYSSTYTRTLDTAAPTASNQQLSVQQYDPRKLEAFSQHLKAGRENALVVGHSNSTAVLAGMLAGDTLEAFDESIYDRIYQVVISGGHGRIHIMHQNFRCKTR